MAKNLLAVALLFFVGCMKQPIHPGAVNQFDSAAYDTLVTVQAAIEEASKQIAAYPTLKPELNKVIDAYNTAQAAYKTYHKAVVAGQPADAAALDAMVQKLKTDALAIVAKLKPQAIWRVHEYYAYA